MGACTSTAKANEDADTNGIRGGNNRAVPILSPGFVAKSAVESAKYSADGWSQDEESDEGNDNDEETMSLTGMEEEDTTEQDAKISLRIKRHMNKNVILQGDIFANGFVAGGAGDGTGTSAGNVKSSNINVSCSLSGGIAKGMPFEDNAWMLHMPKSPDHISRFNRMQSHGWLTPPTSPGKAAGGGGGANWKGGADEDSYSNAGEGEGECGDEALPAPLEGRPATSVLDKAIRGGRGSGSWGESTACPLNFINFNDFRLDFKNRCPRTAIPRGGTIECDDLLCDISKEPKFDRSRTLLIFVSHMYMNEEDVDVEKILSEQQQVEEALGHVSGHAHGPECKQKNKSQDKNKDQGVSDSSTVDVPEETKEESFNSTSTSTNISRYVDNSHHHKFQLIVNAVNLLWTMAKGMQDCYIWMDYCCLDQGPISMPSAAHANGVSGVKMGSTTEELLRIGGLKRIMSYCDCVLTPVVDHNYSSWEYQSRSQPNWLIDYRSEQFQCAAAAAQTTTDTGATVVMVGNSNSSRNRSQSYLQRAWCRLEMLYAANLPLKESISAAAEEERVARLSGGLYVAAKHGIRAHFIYGSKEDQCGFGLVRLPPLPPTFLKNYHPCTGSISYINDEQTIAELVKVVPINKNPITEYYIGERNDQGQKHGRGIFTWDDGSTFNGGFHEDVFHGTDCTYSFTNGDVLCGSYENGRVIGYATLTNVQGDVYYGEIDEKHQKHGTGRINYADGDVYEGCFRVGLRHHKGRMRYREGEEFVGYFKQNKMNGFGTWTYPGGGYFSGYFKNDRRHGEGIFSSSEGTVFEGNYIHGKKDGNGRMTYNNGTTLTGTWSQGKMVGEGVYVLSNGQIQLGYWENGQYIGSEPSKSSADSTADK